MSFKTLQNAWVLSWELEKSFILNSIQESAMPAKQEAWIYQVFSFFCYKDENMDSYIC